MTANELVAWNLRRIRVMRGLSQELLAVDAQIDRTYVSRVERRMENPSVSVLERLAKALDSDIVEFFSRPERGEQPPGKLQSGRKPGRAK